MKDIKEQKNKIQSLGFTLLEMLLVLAISSSLILLMLNLSTQKSEQLRREKTAFQMQQILNAAMSYYINTSTWPMPSGVSCGGTTWRNVTTLSNFFPGYLPNNFTTNPYGNAYFVNCADPSTNSANGANFYVSTTIDKSSNAMIIAGTLPMAFTTNATPTTAPPPTQNATCTATPYDATCTNVVTSVNVPGQNLNNARSINFMGLYYSGSCVPAPTCPAGMSPSIIVATAGVSGDYDTPTCGSTAPYDVSTCSGSINVYPISSFYAYARGSNLTSGVPGSYTSVYNCAGTATQTCRTYSSGNYQGAVFTNAYDTAANYWRVCISVMTSKGAVTPSSSTSASTVTQGKMMGQIAAFTRCVPNSGDEKPSGSFNTYQY